MALYNAGSPPSSPPRVPYWHNESINSGRFERARADASAWAESSNDAIAAQVTQIKELERELQALKLQAESERRFAESQAENSKDARAAKTNAELDRLTVDLEAEGRRSRQLATKVEQARERLYGLKKQASQPAAQMSTDRARTRRLANLAGQLTRTQRKCDEVYAAMKQLKDEARTLETEKSTFEAKLRSLQEEASEHYYEASKAAREYNAANRARDDEVQQTEQLAKQEEAGVKRREAAQKALADAMGAAEKRRALVTSRRKAAISASYAATSSAGGAKAKAYAKEPEVFLATAKPARTLRDVVDRVGQYLGVPQQLGAIVERVLAGAAEERRMVAELKAGRETLAADEAEVARLKVELAGKKGTPTAQAALRERLTELQAAGAKLVAQEEVAQRAVRGVEKEAAALCALLDCEPTPIVQDRPGATRQRLAAIEQHALRAGGSDLQATTAAVAAAHAAAPAFGAALGLAADPQETYRSAEAERAYGGAGSPTKSPTKSPARVTGGAVRVVVGNLILAPALLQSSEVLDVWVEVDVPGLSDAQLQTAARRKNDPPLDFGFSQTLQANKMLPALRNALRSADELDADVYFILKGRAAPTGGGRVLGQGVINLRTLLHHKADWDERPLAIHAAAGGAPVPGPFDAGVVGELTVSLIAHAALRRAAQ